MGRRKGRRESKKAWRRFQIRGARVCGPDYVLREDRTDESGETRWHAIGLVEAVLLLVVHVYRSGINGEEIIRIPERAATGVSARKTRKQERRGYLQ
jgi:uncharacterized DUF497 family protein